MDNKKVPDKWEDYSKIGNVVEGTRFIAFKVPLKQSILDNVSKGVDNEWTVEDLKETVPSPGLGLVIDLTNTTSYYNPQHLGWAIKHVKIATKGQEIPDETVVRKFFTDVDAAMLKKNDMLIGVHCTHGLNRTGYLVCRYMIEKLGMEPETAIAAFDEARGHKQERQDYIQHLKNKEWENSRPVNPIFNLPTPDTIPTGQMALEKDSQPKAEDFKGIREDQERTYDVNGTSGPDNMTALMYAVLNKDYEEMKRLLKQPGITLDCQNKYGQTALHLACRGSPSSLQLGPETDPDSDPEAVKILVLGYQSKKVLKIKDMWDQTPLQAAIGSSNYSEIMKVIQESKKIEKEMKRWRKGENDDDNAPDDETEEDNQPLPLNAIARVGSDPEEVQLNMDGLNI